MSHEGIAAATAVGEVRQGVRGDVPSDVGVDGRDIADQLKVNEGDTVRAGERFGIVKFGSRMDVIVPPEQRLEVQTDLGDAIPKIEDGPWPAFPADLTSIALALATQAELREFVERINAETFGVRLGPIRIGSAKHTRLAQVNLKTGVMTVSKYCLKDVPEQALRYLIIHELAHFYERGHDARFWALVARHVPDYKKQIKIMSAFHSRAVWQDEEADPPEIPAGPAPLPASPPPGVSKKQFFFEQLSLFAHLFQGKNGA